MAELIPRESRCPVCTNQSMPDEASTIQKQGTAVILRGEVNVIVHPGEAHYPPFQSYCTVPLKPKPNGRVKYLKFLTNREVDRWGLSLGSRIRAEGCLHKVDDKELVFDVHDVIID